MASLCFCHNFLRHQKEKALSVVGLINEIGEVLICFQNPSFTVINFLYAKLFYLSKGIIFAFFISLNTYIVRSTEEFKPRKFSPVLHAEKVSAPGVLCTPGSIIIGLIQLGVSARAPPKPPLSTRLLSYWNSDDPYSESSFLKNFEKNKCSEGGD